MECNIYHQKILFGFFKINFAAGINNPAAERQATKQIMDLIGEKFGAAIGAKRDSNIFFHLGSLYHFQMPRIFFC